MASHHSAAPVPSDLTASGSAVTQRPRSSGLPRAIVGASVACGWACYAAWLLPLWPRAVGVAGAVAVTGFMLRAARRRARDLTHGVVAEPRAHVTRWFILNFVLEIALLNLMYAAATTWAPALLIPAISFAVGVHFLPMAWIFRVNRYLVVGCAIIILAASSAVAILLGANVVVVDALEACGNALILWASVYRGTRMSRAHDRAVRA